MMHILHHIADDARIIFRSVTTDLILFKKRLAHLRAKYVLTKLAQKIKPGGDLYIVVCDAGNRPNGVDLYWQLKEIMGPNINIHLYNKQVGFRNGEVIPIWGRNKPR